MKKLNDKMKTSKIPFTGCQLHGNVASFVNDAHRDYKNDSLLLVLVVCNYVPFPKRLIDMYLIELLLQKLIK